MTKLLPHGLRTRSLLGARRQGLGEIDLLMTECNTAFDRAKHPGTTRLIFPQSPELVINRSTPDEILSKIREIGFWRKKEEFS
jgi:hypothetical protein